MKRLTIKYRSALSKQRESAAKRLAAFLNERRANGIRDEQTAMELDSSKDTIQSWRELRRFPKFLMIRGIEAKYGVKIL